MSSSVNCKDHEADRKLWPNSSQAGLDDKADKADVLVLSEVFLESAEALSASVHSFKQVDKHSFCVRWLMPEK